MEVTHSRMLHDKMIALCQWQKIVLIGSCISISTTYPPRRNLRTCTVGSPDCFPALNILQTSINPTYISGPVRYMRSASV